MIYIFSFGVWCKQTFRVKKKKKKSNNITKQKRPADSGVCRHTALSRKKVSAHLQRVTIADILNSNIDLCWCLPNCFASRCTVSPQVCVWDKRGRDVFAVDSAADDHNDNNRETPAWVSIKTRSSSHNTGPINVVARDSNAKIRDLSLNMLLR